MLKCIRLGRHVGEGVFYNDCDDCPAAQARITGGHMFNEPHGPRAIFENHHFRIVLKDPKAQKRIFIVEYAEKDSLGATSWRQSFACCLDEAEHKGYHSYGSMEILQYLLTLISQNSIRIDRGEVRDEYYKPKWTHRSLDRLARNLLVYLEHGQTDQAFHVLQKFFMTGEVDEIPIPANSIAAKPATALPRLDNDDAIS